MNYIGSKYKLSNWIKESTTKVVGEINDKILCDTIKEMLEDSNFTVTAVNIGNDAIDKTYDEKYDAYIFDINLPDMSGIELLGELRASDDLTPCLFLTAKVDIESLYGAFEAGADDYIKKPFFPEELLIRVNAKLSKSLSNSNKDGVLLIISSILLLKFAQCS